VRHEEVIACTCGKINGKLLSREEMMHLLTSKTVNYVTCQECKL